METTKKLFRIKIIKTTRLNYWYSELIGECFHVRETNLQSSKVRWVVDNKNDKHMDGLLIDKNDCILIEDTTNAQSQNAAIKAYVQKWMDSHESDTFVRNQHGAPIYTAGHSSINLQYFFEDILEDFLMETTSE